MRDKKRDNLGQNRDKIALNRDNAGQYFISNQLILLYILSIYYKLSRCPSEKMINKQKGFHLIFDFRT